MKLHLFVLFLIVSCLGQGEKQAVLDQEAEFEQELLHVFKEYDVDADGVLSKEEMFVTMEEELPNKQAITDALDMLNSLYEIYDVNENGLDWQEFQKMSSVSRTAFTDVEDEQLADLLQEVQNIELDQQSPQKEQQIQSQLGQIQQLIQLAGELKQTDSPNAESPNDGDLSSQQNDNKQLQQNQNASSQL